MSHRTMWVGRPVVGVVVATILPVNGIPVAPTQPEPGTRPVASVEAHTGRCLLGRLHAQLVRCDDLTGNGVPAPVFVTKR